MNQLPLHNDKLSYKAPHRNANLPIIQKLTATYKIWQEFLTHFNKNSKYTLGEKIDSLFVALIELIFTASNLYKNQKIPYIQKAITKLDLLKFFLQISWEIKSLDNKKYIILSEQLDEIGKMLGGWNRQLIKENSGFNGEK